MILPVAVTISCWDAGVSVCLTHRRTEMKISTMPWTGLEKAKSTLTEAQKEPFKTMDWRSLDGKDISYSFSQENLPYRRAIALHAHYAWKEATQRNVLPDDFTRLPFEQDVWSADAVKQRVRP